MNKPRSVLRFAAPALLSGLVVLTGCDRHPVASAPPVRPVRLVTVGGAPADATVELAGAVKARVESGLGFRVGGKVIARSVDVGQSVRKGDILMKLDPRDYDLAAQAAKSALASARAALEVAQSEYKRFDNLHQKGLVSETDLERRRVDLSSAQAQVSNAESNAALNANRVEDAILRADSDGVVTAINADTGAVVAAGQPVVTLAHAGEREVEAAFPEDRISLARSARAEVVLWAQPGKVWPARLRELAAAADPVTRTFRARFTVDAPATSLALGQSATLRLTAAAPTASAPVAVASLPTTALVEAGGMSAVWLYDAASSTVKRQPVKVLGVDGNNVLVAGLANGARVAGAGVHVLTDGQKVRPMDAAPAAGASAP